MKKRYLVAIGMSALLAFTGCGSSGGTNNSNNSNQESQTDVTVNINDMANMLVEKVSFSSELKEVDYEFITNYFSIDESTKAVMYASDATCEEVVVFEAKDAVSAKDITTNIDTFLADQRSTFAAYSPDDANRIDNAITKESGRYVVLCVCDDTSAAEELIDDVFSGKTTPEHIDVSENDSDDNKKNPSTDDNNSSDNDGKDSDNKDNSDNDNNDDNDDKDSSGEYETITSDAKVKKYSSVTVVGDAGFSFYGYNEGVTKTYTASLDSLAENVKGSATVYNIPVILASGITFPDNLSEQYNSTYDQNKAVKNIEGLLGDDVVTVNMYDELMKHRKEYLYFRTDHHWTALGAYYAYTQYCEAKGITPEALDSYQTKVFDNFKGSYVSDTKDADLEANPDVITAYLPNASSTSMHVVEAGGKEYDWPIINDVTNYKSGVKYSTFAAGDNAITTLKNNDLTDGSACIVVKDSFGNAFVPFLVDHYQTVYEIDFRYWSGSLAKLAKDNNVTDILFVVNICNTGNAYSAGKIAELCK